MSIQDRLLEIGTNVADWPGPANREQLERRERYVARGISTSPLVVVRAEPTSLALLATGGLPLLGFLRRRR